MCKSTIEMEFEKIFMEQDCFKKQYICMLKEKFISSKKQLKRLILSIFMNHISNNESLALFDEEIFNIYKTIIDNYITFLNNIENMNFKFNNELLKNLSGIVSVLKSQVSFFSDNKNLDINPIYTEKKNVTTKYVDNIYKNLDILSDNSFENIDLKNIKQHFITTIIENILSNYKTNLICCFNSINDIENRKQVKYFKEVLEEEIEILTSIIKFQIKALEDFCENDDEKINIENLLNPIIESYQQTSKSFNELNKKIKSIDTNINIDFDIDNKKIEKFIIGIFKDIKNPEDKFKEKAFKIFEKYLAELKEKTILKEEDNINLFKNNIDKSLNFSQNIRNKFDVICQYIEQNKSFYEKNNVYNIIDGIYESINIKSINIKEKEDEIFLDKDKMYIKINEELKIFKNYDIEYDFNAIYNTLKIDFNMENIKNHINIEPMLCNLEKTFSLYIKKIDDFIKNTILFEISTFQEIMYYSVVRLRDSEDEKIKDFTKYIDNIEMDIEDILTQNNILLIKPNPHDMFNAKEHEVLLAEKNEDFIKGQIIKVVNYGYKEKDKGIIKRATIIAAK
ncbi:nucleotide exchange factor GrpE [[Clostridium] colinum]|uniref:nucleotide exchange factor GrpE n=1 Tax=[Clostridium] colinum TaxID=36835 RepID=UPI002023FB60|nr:nucleotide exchange factor GrpE [[Clostridium] colinum]